MQRDYHVDGQLGRESTPQQYFANMVAVFHELRRVLRDDGILWLNVGDSYAKRNFPGWCTSGGNCLECPGVSDWPCVMMAGICGRKSSGIVQMSCPNP
jgi:hypothetical protein